MNGYEYLRPRTVDEALAMAAEREGACYIAGGTDLMVRIRNREARPRALVSLRNVGGLSGVTADGDTRVGALTTVADVVDDERLGRAYPMLVEAARRLGSVQIRNVATVGGNVCNASPCADVALALLALDAEVCIRGRDGERRMAIGSFFTGPKQTRLEAGEIVTGFVLPRPWSGDREVFFKKGRVSMDLAVASMAVRLDLEGDHCRAARVAAGSVAPTPLRLERVESILVGQRITREVVAEARRAAEESVMPITDVRSTAEYRRRIVGVYLERAILGLVQRSEP